MKEVLDFLNKCGTYYLATVNENNQPEVRPFGFVMDWNGKLAFVTGKSKKVYKQLQTGRAIAVSAFDSPSGTWIRLSGTIKFTEDKAALDKIFEVSPSLLDIYEGGAKNPDIACFYLEKGTAEFWTFASHTAPAKTVIL